MEYTPDRWVVLEISNGTETVRKVFAGWYGGYLGSDSWQLNSGIVETEVLGELVVFKGYSGSVYRCYRNCYGVSMYMADVLDNWLATSKINGVPVNIRVIELEEVVVFQ